MKSNLIPSPMGKELLLQLREASVGFHSSTEGSRTVLRDVNLDLYESELLIITGAIGSGKSLLLAAMSQEANHTLYSLS